MLGQKRHVIVLTTEEVSAAYNALTLPMPDAFLNAPATDGSVAYATANGLNEEHRQRHLESASKRTSSEI
ncbi:hypothetical protein FUT69_04625 [Xylella taiwanensis]|uniref:Uncharacterized protein n=1 Tax=Xylella taiwanensis TaxID=1444770 RepID=Z9JKQ4_9GAMM|nr:hypothetical protein [Xylella taiwanensis]AXI82673.1 hypothetical protein AB672_01140 [Xylella taiwanensis]EWS78347.1 hypothetical protein AF72_06320 [Xylella taiwanensis]MCD8455669.1 hypothetical protein [Xylella taiwanensis]MCD8460212.1 hypothetical protein [Xylella taiwanensis]MCD8463730.1 hypothetical protein [Xylella taiwanensis]